MQVHKALQASTRTTMKATDLFPIKEKEKEKKLKSTSTRLALRCEASQIAILPFIKQMAWSKSQALGWWKLKYEHKIIS